MFLQVRIVILAMHYHNTAYTLLFAPGAVSLFKPGSKGSHRKLGVPLCAGLPRRVATRSGVLDLRHLGMLVTNLLTSPHPNEYSPASPCR